MRKTALLSAALLMMPLCALSLTGCVKKPSITVDGMKNMVHLGAKDSLSLSHIDGLSDNAGQAFKTAFENHAHDYGFQYKASSYYHLKGYISVEKDDESHIDTVYYVFDLFDQANQRLHRLGGKKTYPHRLMTDHINLPQNAYDDIVKAVLEQVKNWSASQMR